MKKHINAVLIALIFAFVTGTTAHAALETQNYMGNITFAETANPFGVSVDDTFTWNATYDPADLDAFNMIDISKNPSYHLNIHIGDRTFVETEDEMYTTAFGGPFLFFDAQNQVNGVSLLVDDTVNNYRFRSSGDGLAFDIYSLGADGFSDDVHLVSGTFNFNPVPIPGAVWLLGTGLVSLAGLRRTKAPFSK